MGDPVGAARHVRQALRPDGVLLLVEPNGADRPEDNHHPLGPALLRRLHDDLCTPASLAQEGQLGLGNQAGAARVTEILTTAGFSSARVATSTPINVIVDARP